MSWPGEDFNAAGHESLVQMQRHALQHLEIWGQDCAGVLKSCASTLAAQRLPTSDMHLMRWLHCR